MTEFVFQYERAGSTITTFFGYLLCFNSARVFSKTITIQCEKQS